MPHVESLAMNMTCLLGLVCSHFGRWVFFSVLACSLIDSSAPEIEFHGGFKECHSKYCLRKKTQVSLVTQGIYKIALK